MVAVAMQQGRISKIYSSVVSVDCYQDTFNSLRLLSPGRWEPAGYKLPGHASPRGVHSASRDLSLAIPIPSIHSKDEGAVTLLIKNTKTSTALAK